MFGTGVSPDVGVNRVSELVTRRENPTVMFLSSRLVRCSFEESGRILVVLWLQLVEAEIGNLKQL